MLIAFSGVDCSGKSTQIQWLRNYFVSSGKTVTTFWYRPGYSKELQAGKDVLRKFYGLLRRPFAFVDDKSKRLSDSRGAAAGAAGAEASDRQNGPETAAKTSPSPPSASSVPAPLWLSTALMDTALQWGVKLRYLQRRYDVVICDRYFEDARLDLLFKYPEHGFSDRVLKGMQAYLPIPDHYFVLTLPFETVLERAEAKDEPFPEDEATRKRRFRAYERTDFGVNAHRIDAGQSIEALHHAILKQLDAKDETP